MRRRLCLKGSMEHERQRVRRFLEQNFLYGQTWNLADSDSFLEAGILDSTGVLQLISFLNESFGIAIADEEVTPDNLDSIDRIAAFLDRKSALTSGGGQGELGELS